ncbi:dihydrofolate reductase [Mucilaginibacter sp. JRF]|uniref:dihydrofolate reductase family protein n=1 Tax=Mucilaginibacter sp. JRF TaxID=2780088 RepID=UPI00187ED973|nr:dihydrofolate reductase family protein [Mucilaginibacter sp. JRF]MBE9585487.1 dihydrofolate reductase [Mucilaginibacter sp. JRF]
MRKIILNVAVSLDGFIEGPNGEYDWCFTDQDYGMEAFTADVDAVFIGRKSYDVLQEYGNPWPDKRLYIFSDTLTDVEGNAEIIRSENFIDRIDEIRYSEGKNIWLFGGANLLSQLLHKNYVNELLLSVHPIVLGTGTPLFKGLTERLELNLIDSAMYDTGLVQLTYSLKPKFDFDMLPE